MDKLYCVNCHKDTVRVLGEDTKYWWCDYCQKSVNAYKNPPAKPKAKESKNV